MQSPGWFADYIERFAYDPLGWALWAFPWKANTEHPLRQQGICIDPDGSGLEAWQIQHKIDLGNALKEAARKPAGKTWSTTVSGRGTGKGADGSQNALFWFTTRPNSKGVLSANTFTQVASKTVPEIRKWHEWLHPAIKDWLKIDSQRMVNQLSPDRWFLSFLAWDEKRPEAFQGEHNEHPFLWFDEASGIPKPIYDAVEGFFTSGHGLWVAYGNGNNNSGPFYDSHNRFRHLWLTRSVDARSIKRPHDIELFEQWIAAYGEDSDFVRVHVKGMFPRSGFMQFIPTELIEEARDRRYQREVWERAPLVAGCDCAEGGEDEAAMVLRQGQWLPTPAVYTWRGLDPIALGEKFIDVAIARDVDAVAIDGVGVGSGAYATVKRAGLDPYNVNAGRAGVDIGKSAARKGGAGVEYLNLGTKLWGDGRQWLRDGGSLLHADQAMLDDLRNRQYTVCPNTGLVALEPKAIMKARGLPSPDRGDAWAHTFAPRIHAARGAATRARPVVAQCDYNPFS